jgi:hypothetical protein
MKTIKSPSDSVAVTAVFGGTMVGSVETAVSDGVVGSTGASRMAVQATNKNKKITMNAKLTFNKIKFSKILK